MKKGDIIYVHSLEDKSQPGKLMIYQETCCKKDPPRIQGVSVYEECILCKDPKTGALNQFGARHYHWEDPVEYIEHLKNVLQQIKNIAQFA